MGQFPGRSPVLDRPENHRYDEPKYEGIFMVARLLIVMCVVALFTVVTIWLKRRQLNRARIASSELVSTEARDRMPTLVYFWSEGCGQCRSTQAPIVERLGETLGAKKLRVEEIDVGKEPQRAAAWGVRTVPTIYILDKQGGVKYVQNGIATDRVIRDQLHGLVD